ncbi:MAG: CHC2 zinc finger domain-containing protein [Oscillospiraceae bacterium]
MIDAADYIRSAASMKEVVELYGMTPNRAGFIDCPFHDEKTASMKIYAKRAVCFGCGWSGGIIDFVGSLFDLPFVSAKERLANDLGLSERLSVPDPRDLRRRDDEKRKKEAELERQREKYDAACLEYRRLWLAKRLKAPKSPEEEFDSEYVEACKRLPAADWWFSENHYK